MATSILSPTYGGMSKPGSDLASLQAPQTWSQLMAMANLPNFDREFAGTQEPVVRDIPGYGRVTFIPQNSGPLPWIASYKDENGTDKMLTTNTQPENGQPTDNIISYVPTYKGHGLAGGISGVWDAVKVPVLAAVGANLAAGALGTTAGGTTAGTTAAGTTAAGSGASLGTGLTPGAGGITGLSAIPSTSASLSAPIATGGAGTGLGLGATAAGAGLASGIGSLSPSLASNLTSVPSNIGTASGAGTVAERAAAAGIPASVVTNASTTATGASALSKVLDGTATASDYLSLGLPIAGAIAGAVGADSKPAGTTTTVTDIPDWLKPYVVGNLDAAKAYMAANPQDNSLLDPATAQLKSTINGDYLNNNPYIDATYKQAADAVIPGIDSQFSKAGRYGSGAMAATLGTTLGNLATNIYGQNYANERAKQVAAATAAPGFTTDAANAPFSAFNNFSNLTKLGVSSTTSPYFTNPTGGAISGLLAGYGLSKAL